MSPLSGNSDARERQLANLRNAPAAPAGNQRHRTHGGYARIAGEQMEAKAREVFEALAGDAPLRDTGGGLPAADTLAVRMLAECLVRLDRVAADVRDHGWKDERTGDQRPVIELETRLRAEALTWARELGMTPAARVRLGLDLAQISPTAAVSERDHEFASDPGVQAAARELVRRAAHVRAQRNQQPAQKVKIPNQGDQDE
jgi:phage terminase small subunit